MLKVYPQSCFAPCTLRVQTRVEPHQDNRAVIWEVQGENYYSQSSIGLNGDQTPPTQDARFYRDLPEGDYTVSAAVMRTPEKIVGLTTIHVSIR